MTARTSDLIGRIRSPLVRARHVRALRELAAWCEEHGTGLHDLDQTLARAYLADLRQHRSPSVLRRHAAILRTLLRRRAARQEREGSTP